MSLKTGFKINVPFELNATELAAPTNYDIVSPIDGYIDAMLSTVQTAIVTGGDITVLTGDAGGTTVAGLTTTVANSAAKGTRYSAQATAGSATRKVSKGDRIQIVPGAAFNGGGAVTGFLVISTSDVSPAL